MAVKTYQAGVKEYRSTYWEPNYTVKDTDILACFKITRQTGVDREEAARARKFCQAISIRALRRPSTKTNASWSRMARYCMARMGTNRVPDGLRPSRVRARL